jgi:hypothetical protein
MEPHVGDADSTAGSQGAGQVGAGVALSARVQKAHSHTPTGAVARGRGVVLSGTQVFRLVPCRTGRGGARVVGESTVSDPDAGHSWCPTFSWGQRRNPWSWRCGRASDVRHLLAGRLQPGVTCVRGSRSRSCARRAPGRWCRSRWSARRQATHRPAARAGRLWPGVRHTKHNGPSPRWRRCGGAVRQNSSKSVPGDARRHRVSRAAHKPWPGRSRP